MSNTFTVNDKSYELLQLDDLPSMTLGEVEILETVGGLNVNDLESVPVTVKLIVALVHVSMLRSDPDAKVDDAKLVKVSVLEQLAETVANAVGDDVADPPTELAAPAESSAPGDDGPQDSRSDSASDPGSSSSTPSTSGVA